MSEEEFEIEEAIGIALGFRIVEQDGKHFLAEAEIAPYLDAPDELGVTVVFHPLDGLSPVEVEEEIAWPSWPLDIDDDLKIDTSAPMTEQFSAVVKQLRTLSEDQLRKYLDQAREDAEE